MKRSVFTIGFARMPKKPKSRPFDRQCDRSNRRGMSEEAEVAPLTPLLPDSQSGVVVTLVA